MMRRISRKYRWVSKEEVSSVWVDGDGMDDCCFGKLMCRSLCSSSFA